MPYLIRLELNSLKYLMMIQVDDKVDTKGDLVQFVCQYFDTTSNLLRIAFIQHRFALELYNGNVGPQNIHIT